MIKIDKSLYLRMGELLRKKREERGYSLEQVAEAVGLTKKTIQRYETAESRITTENLKKICDFMGFDPKEVAGFFVIHLSKDEDTKDEVRHINLLEEIDNSSLLEDSKKFLRLLSNKPELFRTYLNIYNSKDLQNLCKNLEGLTEQELSSIITIVRGFKNGREQEM